MAETEDIDNQVSDRCIGPMGGRIEKFRKVLQDFGADPWVVSTIKEGCNLEFHHKLPLTSQPKFNLNSKHLQVNTEFQKMVDKGALERVQNNNTPGFYSIIFLVFFFGSQKDRRSKTSNRSQTLKHLPVHKMVQNGDCPEH